MASAKNSVGLFKRAWHEVPEIVGGTVNALIGVGITFLALSIYQSRDGNNRKYKMEYTVIRDDDPRASKVKSGPDAR